MSPIDSETLEDERVLPGGQPLQLLFEQPGLPVSLLSPALAAVYGSGLRLLPGSAVANFVSSVDGVVALPAEQESGAIVSGKNPADRFVMGLLRACAGMLVVGAGTFRKAARAQFDAAAIYPPAAALFAQLRARLGLAARPQLVLVSGSGELDVSGPAIPEAWIVTTPEGEARLRPRVPGSTRLLALPTARLALAEVLGALGRPRSGLLLSEGGPALFAQLLADQVVDELFLTVAPTLFGRFPGDGRKSLAEGLDLGRAAVTLRSVHQHASYLFVRYALGGSERQSR